MGPVSARSKNALGIGRAVPAWLLAAGAAIVVAVAVADVLAYERVPVLRDAAPSASPRFLLRDSALAVAAVVGLVGLVRYPAASRPAATAVRLGVGRVSVVWPALSLVAAVGLVLVMAVDPARVTRLALEDGPVENASAVLLLVGAVAAGWRALTTVAARRVADTAVLLVVAVGMFVMGMEEISWGQRIFGFETPGALSGNLQDEANLHNLFTDPLELLFAVLTVVLFVVAPLAVPRTPLARRFPGLVGVLPTLPLQLTFAPAAAISYDMWNMAPVQIGFWITCAVLAWLITCGVATGRERSQAAATLAVCIGVQSACLLLGGRSDRLGDVTEYRELVTAIALSAWAISITPRTGTAVAR